MFVADDFGKSENKKQKSGIRQGCPLSPFLFVLMMTCIERDVISKLSTDTMGHRLENMDYDMVFYADDTIVFPKHLKALKKYWDMSNIYQQTTDSDSIRASVST